MVDQNNRNNLLLLFINLAYSQLSPFSFMAWSWQLTSWSNKKCCNWCLYLFQEKIISFDRKNEYQVDSFSEKHELKVWALREKCPNTEFLLDCIFLHLDWIRVYIQSKCGKMRTRKNSVFEHFSRSGVEKCRTEQLRSNRIGPNKLNARWESNFRIVKGCFYELIRKIELLIRHQKNEWFRTYVVFEKSGRRKLTL